MMTLSVQIKDAGLKQRLSGLISRAKNPTPVLAWVGRYMAYDVGGVFSEFQTRGRGSWAPLRLRMGQPLRDARTLERSIGWKVIGRNDVVVGTNLKYARVHQYGATIKAKTARGLLFIGPVAGVSGKKGASIRRTGKMPKSGKLPSNLRWYRLMKVTIPRRRFLIWRPAQLKTIIARARQYILTGQIPPAALSGGGGQSSTKLVRR